jgi:transcriptional regulator with XRE-family HTH domain
MSKRNPSKEYKMNVGENIRIWREIKGLKQDELARRLDIASPTLSNIENGVSKPNTDMLEDIADALGIEVNQLLTNPQQTFTFTNSPQSNGVIYGNSTQQNVDKTMMERMITIMERMTELLTFKK